MSRLSSRLFLAPVSIQILLRWRDHEIGFYARHSGDLSNYVGDDLLQAGSHNDP